MALGLIPVAADIPGVREWLRPDSGYLFDRSDGDSLRGLITKFIERDDDHGMMRKGNLERVQAEAIFEDNVAETIKLMRDIAENE